MRRASFALALLLGFCVIPADAQFSDDFETGAPGWTFDAAVGGCSWAVDATPATSFYVWQCSAAPFAPGPAATVFAGANALNWNNGTSHDYAGAGLPFDNSAISPVITVSSTVGLTLTFQCFYESEGCTFASSNSYKIVDILPAASLVPIASFICAVDNTAPPPPGSSVCGNGILDSTGNMSSHHLHTIDLSPLALTDFRLGFRFRGEGIIGVTDVPAVGDTFEGQCCGWFVDNVNVQCLDGIPPTAPTLLFPADLACVPSPITFDWTDATDTTTCGAGTISGYDIEIDTTAAFLAPTVFFTPVSSITLIGPPGTFFWRVRAYDALGLAGPYSSVFSFTVELPAAPLAPDTLHVNEDYQTSQGGDPGFVDPVLDQTPAFSAIYRDANCSDFAIQVYYEVSLDPTFLTGVMTDGPIGLAPPLPIDSRCPDLLPIGFTLQRGLIYFWRIRFSDASGPGAFSVPQSFRIGDDFDFGVRNGSSHHGRRCWVATAAWGSDQAQVVTSLQSWRTGTLESAPSGRLASRLYHSAGATAASVFQAPGLIRTATSGIAFGMPLALVLAFGLALLGLVRISRSA
ncbi:MAG: hypothetical protein FD180_2574 [Planctomycetota bacterium]|nr:MAG: hypothetical protein FD180_2574 [Planctomycetota bacterium]